MLPLFEISEKKIDSRDWNSDQSRMKIWDIKFDKVHNLGCLEKCEQKNLHWVIKTFMVIV